MRLKPLTCICCGGQLEQETMTCKSCGNTYLKLNDKTTIIEVEMKDSSYCEVESFIRQLRDRINSVTDKEEQILLIPVRNGKGAINIKSMGIENGAKEDYNKAYRQGYNDGFEMARKLIPNLIEEFNKGFSKIHNDEQYDFRINDF